MEQQEKKREDPAEFGYGLFSVGAAGPAVVMRSGFGPEAFGVHFLAAAILMLLIASQSRGDLGMLRLFVVWFGFLIYRRIESLVMQIRGVIVHSRWQGTPWLARLFPFGKNEVVARAVIEPAICMLAGMILAPSSPIAGKFVFFTAFAMMGKEALDRLLRDQRIRRMRDARIEGEFWGSQL